MGGNHSSKFASDLNIGSKNLFEVNNIGALIGHSICVTGKTSVCSVGSERHCAAGSAEVDTNLSGTDSSAPHMNTPMVPLSALLNAAISRLGF